MPPKLSKERKLQDDDGDSPAKKTAGSNTAGKRKPSDNNGSNGVEPALTDTTKTSIWDDARKRHEGKASVGKTPAKGEHNSNEMSRVQSHFHADWQKTWGKLFHPEMPRALWDARQQSSLTSDGSVFVVSYHRYGAYVDSKVKVLGV